MVAAVAMGKETKGIDAAKSDFGLGMRCISVQGLHAFEVCLGQVSALTKL